MFGNKLKKNNGFSRNDLGVRNPLSKVAIEHFLVFRGTLEGATNFWLRQKLFGVRARRVVGAKTPNL
jgi:hypothetical protein